MTRPGLLGQTISEELVRRFAGDRYYQRGVDYFQRGRVSSIEESGKSIHAVVNGTDSYGVVLAVKGDNLDYNCECPLGVDGEFCKHCVATALAWLSGKAVLRAGASDKVSAAVTDEDVIKALEKEDKAALIQLLLEAANDDEALRGRLMLLAAGQKGIGAFIRQAGRTLERAIRVRGFVDYRGMPGYVARVEVAIDAVESLLKHGQPGSVIDLCESGLRGLAVAIESTDDSDGYVGGLMERLQDLHLRACEQARPDPEELARKLLFFELKADYGEWYRSTEKYAEVLGPAGMAAFRKLADAEWAKVPVRVDRRGYSGDGQHYRLTGIMESLARQSGDIEQLVAVLEKNLGSAHQFLRIAGVYHEAGNHDKALAWAERGAASVSGYDGAALRLFVAEEYQRRERHADALRIVWVEFRNSLGLESYKTLRKFATQAGDWDEWRKRAFDHIRRTIAGKSGEVRNEGTFIQRWRDRKRDHSLLVEIFLEEKKYEDAWQEAQTGGCRDDLWLRLAEKRKKKYPEDAAPIYLRLGEQAIVNAQSSRYESAIALLEKAAALLHLMGRSEEFEEQFEALRQKYKAKRNLQKLAEERRRFLYLRQ